MQVELTAYPSCNSPFLTSGELLILFALTALIGPAATLAQTAILSGLTKAQKLVGFTTKAVYLAMS